MITLKIQSFCVLIGLTLFISDRLINIIYMCKLVVVEESLDWTLRSCTVTLTILQSHRTEFDIRGKDYSYITLSHYCIVLAYTGTSNVVQIKGWMTRTVRCKCCHWLMICLKPGECTTVTQKLNTSDFIAFYHYFAECEIGVEWASANSLAWSIGRSIGRSFLGL